MKRTIAVTVFTTGEDEQRSYSRKTFTVKAELFSGGLF